MKGFRSRILSVPAWLVACFGIASAQSGPAPGAPGKDAQWASAGKQGIGTSNTLESKVWFTLQGGTLTEVVEMEREDAISHPAILSDRALVFRQTNIAKSAEWKIIKTYSDRVRDRSSSLAQALAQPLPWRGPWPSSSGLLLI
jgi:hypothetical protein